MPAHHIAIRHSHNVISKTGVPQGGVLSPKLFNICTTDIPPPREPVQGITYADDITIIFTHMHKCIQEIHTTIPTYSFCLDKTKQYYTKSRKKNFTLFTPDPAEYKSQLDLKINNTALPMATHPKVMGLSLDPKLAYNTHIHNISVQAHIPIQMIKALTAT